MSHDIEDYLRTEMRAATRGLDGGPRLTFAALSRGRRRRRRRIGLVAAGTCGAVVLGLAAAPTVASLGDRSAAPASGDRADTRVLEWARELPKGGPAGLPYYASGQLRDGSTTVDVPAEVNRSVPARRVDGGWVVVINDPHPDLTPAVLSRDGELSPLPTHRPQSTDEMQAASATVVTAPDGDQVAYGDQVVELSTGNVFELPHDPADAADTDSEYSNTLQLVGWSDEGLVYTGSPQVDGLGTEWLWRPGQEEAVRLSEPTMDAPQSLAGSSTGWSLGIRYTDDEKDTCTTTRRLTAEGWSEQGAEQCMGQYLGEALDVSPDGRWLLTDDLPRVWNLRDGEWATIDDLPAAMIRDAGEAWMSDIGWEDDEHVLFTASTRPASTDTGTDGDPIRFRGIVVRCSVTSGQCERAGEEYTYRLDPMALGWGRGFSSY